MIDLCSVDGCTEPEEAAGLCAGHRKRKQRGQDVNVQLEPQRGSLTPWQLLQKASADLEDADIKDDPAFVRAELRLQYAAIVFAASRRKRLTKTSRPSGDAPEMRAFRTPRSVIRLLAAKASCDERTIRKALHGEPIRLTAGGLRALTQVRAAPAWLLQIARGSGRKR